MAEIAIPEAPDPTTPQNSTAVAKRVFEDRGLIASKGGAPTA